MISKTAINGLMIVLIAVGIALPLATQQHASEEAREKEKLLRGQQNDLARLTTDNARLSNELFQASGGKLSDEQMRELLKLRAEAATLHRQINETQRLREENRRLQLAPALRQNSTAAAKEEYAKALSAELLEAARNILAELPEAEQRFHADNPGSTISIRLRSMAEAGYFPKTDGKWMPGLHSFEFVRDELPKPGDSVILRETSPRETTDGRTVAIYGFSDGHVAEIMAPQGTDASEFFDSWQQQRLSPTPPQEK